MALVDHVSRLKLALQKAFVSVNKSLLEWNKVNKSCLISVKELSILGQTLRSCANANVESTKVVKSHPWIKEKLLLKLEKDIEIERCNLNNKKCQLGVISNRISNENNTIYSLYSAIVDDRLIDFQSLELNTEICPSISKLIKWHADIDKEIETAYIIRKFVTETTNFNILEESNLFSNTWNNNNHLSPINEIMCYVNFFIKSDV